MIDVEDILETNRMIREQNLDVRTITMGISLRDCCDPNLGGVFAASFTKKLPAKQSGWSGSGRISKPKYGVPIINKRISVTPIAIVAEACRTDSYEAVAQAMDRAAKTVGVNFIGGFSALVHKGFTAGRPRFAELDSAGAGID